jgi:glycosyltransferase involved in cell wall biosynthesis
MWGEPYFDRRVAERFAGRNPILYGHEHASALSFRTQKRAGGLCVLRQVMAHFAVADRIADEELERFPEVDSDYERLVRATRRRVNDRKREEYETADLIVANSEFVRRSLVVSGVPNEKVVTIPTGCPGGADPGFERRRTPPSFLSVGHLSLRKGTPYLIDAWRRAAPRAVAAQLRLAGAVQLPPAVLGSLPEGIRIEGPLGAAQLQPLYRQASAFVLPALCEGLSHAVLEALSYGLPVITTANSGAEGLVVNGVNGWIVPIRDASALADRLIWCLDHPAALEAMGAASLAIAREWSRDRSSSLQADAIAALLNGGSPHALELPRFSGSLTGA